MQKRPMRAVAFCTVDGVNENVAANNSDQEAVDGEQKLEDAEYEEEVDDS